MESARPTGLWIESASLGLFTSIVCLVVGYELVFRYQLVQVDAWTRALEAFYATMPPSFHLAAMGFIWNPLPSLLALPLAELRWIWPSLMTVGFASNIISSLFAAVGAIYLDRLLWRFGLGRTARILWVLLYVLNPLVLYYTANGMSDGMMAAAAIACLEGVVAYLETDRLTSLVSASCWIAAGFMTRYESVPIGAALGIGIAIAVYRRSGDRRKAEAAAVMFYVPIFCAGVIWMLLNWMIEKSPLYFLDSADSNAKQISSGGYNTPLVLAAAHHLGAAAGDVLHFTILFWPFLPLVAIMLLVQLKRGVDPVGTPILLAAFGAPLLQLALLYLHKSAAWSRFFIYYIPFGVMLLGALYYYLRPRLSKWATITVPLFLTFVLLSADLVTWNALHSHRWGHGVASALAQIQQVRPGEIVPTNPYVLSGEQMAAYINTHPNLKVLVSTFSTFELVPFVRNTSQLVITNDSDFKAVLQNPLGRVNAILVVPPNNIDSKSDPIVRQYPTMWSGGLPWAKLVHQFPNQYRLFRITSSAP
jgi:hypothetical protein